MTTTYAYNNANRMASFTKGTTTRGTYTYNARGQLVIRNVTNSSNNGITVYFYDRQGHVIAEYNGSNGNLIREYVWLGDMPLAVIDPGSPSTTYYVHADHLNRPVAMSNAAKTFVANYVWLPYGGLHSYTGTTEVDLRFPGQLMQAESGLYYNWNRQYDPTTGRYTQADPLGLVDGSSRYAYVNNNPLQQVDPEGLVSQSLPLIGPAGGRLVLPGRQVRFYDLGGNAICDIDLTHDHGFSIPHFHFWYDGVRGPATQLISK